MFAWSRSRGVARARPQYLWCVLRAARTAKNLGIDRVCAIEFGVAGGNGLIALESAAEAAESLLNVAIETYGFDSGGGLPEPKGVKDAPFELQTGFFAMDETELRARLSRTRLVLGLVEETVGEWMSEDHPPVGFISFDLDYYSSTVHALGLLDAAPSKLLPRVVCYFDDIFGYAWSDFNGERAAIAEFNDAREHRKISPIYGIKYSLSRRYGDSAWPAAIFLAHSFDHDLYGEADSPPSVRSLEAHRLSLGVFRGRHGKGLLAPLSRRGPRARQEISQ